MTTASNRIPYRVRTQVAIIGAGPAGLLLSHMLSAEGIASALIETRPQGYVLSRIRAGILEQSTVDLLDAVGLGTRLHREGLEHQGIYLQWPEERYHLNFVDLVGRGVWVYGQTEVTKDLMAACEADGQPMFYDVTDTALHHVDTEAPFVTFVDACGKPMRLDAQVIAGCDGSRGPSRAAVPDNVRQTWEHGYPYSWLGVLADVAPSTDNLIYAWHPQGFALHSMRSRTVSRLYLQVPNDTDPSSWSDERIWESLRTRLGHGQNGWELASGPITDRSVLPMRSYVQSPMRYGRLFLAGDAAHTVPPAGAKGLNLAVADVALLAPALIALLRRGNARLVNAYSETALRRVWRCTHFSWWMTTMLHISDSQAGASSFEAQLQLSQLRWIAASSAASTGLAENYVGLPIGS
jgi:p-hydroxybenzoate 3-monooxygenase